VALSLPYSGAAAVLVEEFDASHSKARRRLERTADLARDNPVLLSKFP
jgi:hypothetical protein